MSLLDELRKKQDILKSAGLGIRAEAVNKDASFSYIDPAEPDVVVVEHRREVTREKLSTKERRVRK